MCTGPYSTFGEFPYILSFKVVCSLKLVHILMLKTFNLFICSQLQFNVLALKYCAELFYFTSQDYFYIATTQTAASVASKYVLVPSLNTALPFVFLKFIFISILIKNCLF